MYSKNIWDCGGVYLLRNTITNEIYIGKANVFRKRMGDHRRDSLTFKNKSYLANATRKYGWENFEIYFLEIFDTLNVPLIVDLEYYWIKLCDATNPLIGYNQARYSNDCTGMKRPQYVKDHLSKIMKGEGNHFYGKTHSPEAKERMSKQRKGRVSVFKGRKHKPESIEKCRLGNLGRKHPEFKRPVKQLDLKSGELIKIWESAKDASLGIKGKNTFAPNIIGAIRGYKTYNGYTFKSAIGYKWGYATKEELEKWLAENSKGMNLN